MLKYPLFFVYKRFTEKCPLWVHFQYILLGCSTYNSRIQEKKKQMPSLGLVIIILFANQSELMHVHRYYVGKYYTQIRARSCLLIALEY